MRHSRIILTCAATLALYQFSTRSAAAASPVIQAVVNAGNYQPVIASATWVAIVGTNLAESSRAWAAGDFIGTNLPTHLDDVSVTINGVAAYTFYISPGQINVLVPDDPTIGTVSVVVSNANGTSSAFPANKQSVSPSLFAYAPLGAFYAVTEKAPAYGLVATPRLLGPTVTTTTAAPGDTIVLYGTGLGPVTPAHSTGQLVTTPAPTASPILVLIGNQPAKVTFAGLISAGLYQINLVVPAVRTGDALVVVTAGGKQSGGSVHVPIQAYGDPSGQTAPTPLTCLKGPVDYITFDAALLYYGQTIDVSIAGTHLCPTCNIQAPVYPEFTARLERALERKHNVQACYDTTGNIYEVTVLR